MKANELRIGNIVYVDDKEYHSDLQEVPMCIISIYNKLSLGGYCVTVDKLNKNEYDFQTSLRLRYIKPVPLTEEILLKCGFKKIPKNLYVDNMRDLRTAVTYKNGVIFWNEDTEMVWVGNTVVDNIDFLHQLQNLYYATTGEELKVEL